MKLDVKVKAIAIFLAFLMFVGVVYSSYWIYSLTVTVNVQSVIVNLSSDATTITKYHFVNFTVTLAKNGATIIGATIYFDFENGTNVGTFNESPSGVYKYQWNATGTATFKARYLVP